MFYTEAEGHPLPFDPFKAIIAPRPIGWISSLDSEGRPNLAPYSFFCAIASKPNMVGFTSDGLKHSVRNIRDTGEFVFNLSTMELLHEMNATSTELEDGEDEFSFAGLEAAPSALVKPPRVARAAAALECKLTMFSEIQDLSGEGIDRWLAIGQVVAVHIDDRFIKAGRFDTAAAQPLGRCGYRDYAVVDEMFELLRPTDPGRVIR
ncbi:MAG: flavin reductase family protein [Azospirillaceae bacterium]